MIKSDDLHRWFCSDVLPLEAEITRYLWRNRVAEGEISDLRQDVYERALHGATQGLPYQTRPYVFAIARNLLINRARRAQIVSLEFMATWDLPEDNPDVLTPERHADGRAQMRLFHAGLEQLAPRCREAVRLRKIEGLSIKEVAQRMNVGVDAVEQQTAAGMRALVDFMLGGSGKVRRRPNAGGKARVQTG